MTAGDVLDRLQDVPRDTEVRLVTDSGWAPCVGVAYLGLVTRDLGSPLPVIILTGPPPAQTPREAPGIPDRRSKPRGTTKPRQTASRVPTALPRSGPPRTLEEWKATR